MRTETSAVRWDGPVAAFDEGTHHDAFLAGERVARVVVCRRLAGMDVMPYPSGRRRRLFLALAGVDRRMQIVGVLKTLRAAKRECELAVCRLGCAAESSGTT
jgi:hypothetical protein